MQVAAGACIAGAARIIGVDINPKKFDQGIHDTPFLLIIIIIHEMSIDVLCDFVARHFGVTDCVNPLERNEPVHQVLFWTSLFLKLQSYLRNLLRGLEGSHWPFSAFVDFFFFSFFFW